MRYLLLAILLLASSVQAESLKTVSFVKVPHDRESRLLLEGERVVDIREHTFHYNLGHEVITIRARSLDGQAFLRNIESGRRHARLKAVIKPVMKTTFNTDFYIDH